MSQREKDQNIISADLGSAVEGSQLAGENSGNEEPENKVDFAVSGQTQDPAAEAGSDNDKNIMEMLKASIEEAMEKANSEMENPEFSSPTGFKSSENKVSLNPSTKLQELYANISLMLDYYHGAKRIRLADKVNEYISFYRYDDTENIIVRHLKEDKKEGKSETLETYAIYRGGKLNKLESRTINYETKEYPKTIVPYNTKQADQPVLERLADLEEYTRRLRQEFIKDAKYSVLQNSDCQLMKEAYDPGKATSIQEAVGIMDNYEQKPVGFMIEDIYEKVCADFANLKLNEHTTFRNSYFDVDNLLIAVVILDPVTKQLTLEFNKGVRDQSIDDLEYLTLSKVIIDVDQVTGEYKIHFIKPVFSKNITFDDDKLIKSDFTLEQNAEIELLSSLKYLINPQFKD